MEWMVCMESLDDPPTDEPDLTMIDAGMYYHDGHVFMNELKEYNLPLYNFIHHLLFTGWAENDCYTSPGSCSPYRGRLIREDDWHGGHRESFYEMFQCFMCLHKSNEVASVPPQNMLEWHWNRPECTLSQVWHIPRTILQCVTNCVDHRARSLLGKPIADSIDIYRLLRETYADNEDELDGIYWMPCLGVSAKEYMRVSDYHRYNPHHTYPNIAYTGLLWRKENDDNDA